MVIELKLADYLEMVRHARVLAPIEDCGLLGGTVADGVKTVEKVYYLTNTDHSEEHFSLDPKEQFAAVKEMREAEGSDGETSSAKAGDAEISEPLAPERGGQAARV